MMKSKDKDQPLIIPRELWDKIASFIELKDLQDLATVSKAFSDEASNKRAELKKIADELIKTNDKSKSESIQNFLKEAHKNHYQWLLDYCYQAAVNYYFIDKSGQINHQKLDNQKHSILDWAIKCFQPINTIQTLCDATRIFDRYFRNRKFRLAVKVGNISMIKFLPQGDNERLGILESLTLEKNTTAIFKEVFPFFAAKLKGDSAINLLKLALLDHNVEKAKVIVKESQSVPEMIKTRGKALFSDKSKGILLGAKLLSYWSEKVDKIDKTTIKNKLGKRSFFNSLLARSQHQKYKEDHIKLQLIEKLMKRVIEDDKSIELTNEDFSLIRKSKKLTELYNSCVELSGESTLLDFGQTAI
jgi:hypothetical protein